MSVYYKELLIFDKDKKKARKIEFQHGINIITSKLNSVGKTLEVFVDIGHTTTYINMVKKISDDEYENIPFSIPKSLKVADNGKENDVASNFLSEDGNWGQTRKVKYLKNMLHCFRDYDSKGINSEKLRSPTYQEAMVACNWLDIALSSLL